MGKYLEFGMEPIPMKYFHFEIYQINLDTKNALKSIYILFR
jgi:hypothetical protein